MAETAFITAEWPPALHQLHDFFARSHWNLSKAVGFTKSLAFESVLDLQSDGPLCCRTEAEREPGIPFAASARLSLTCNGMLRKVVRSEALTAPGALFVSSLVVRILVPL